MIEEVVDGVFDLSLFDLPGERVGAGACVCNDEAIYEWVHWFFTAKHRRVDVVKISPEDMRNLLKVLGPQKPLNWVSKGNDSGIGLMSACGQVIVAASKSVAYHKARFCTSLLAPEKYA